MSHNTTLPAFKPEVSWKQVVKAAGLVRTVLKTLGLSSWVKTTGGRGLHVVLPITPARSVAECLEFSRTLSEVITRTDPQLYTTTFAKLGRERKILIDYLRNNRTNTSICAYSPRARPRATVSMPLDWSELSASPERWMLTTSHQGSGRGPAQAMEWSVRGCGRCCSSFRSRLEHVSGPTTAEVERDEAPRTREKREQSRGCSEIRLLRSSRSYAWWSELRRREVGRTIRQK
jgi:hypothetical protein